jgi:AcrR family transcriptional regulator
MDIAWQPGPLSGPRALNFLPFAGSMVGGTIHAVPVPSTPHAPMMNEQGVDVRVLRTQRALGGALVELMLTQEFDAITVQDVLDRAGVGRSTFHTHFRNKDDLLLSDAERFLTALESQFHAVAGHSPRVAPIAELFGHVREFEAFADALHRTARQEAAFGLVLGHLARIIEQRLALLAPGPDALPLSRGMTSRVFAAAAIEMLRWWMDRRPPLTAPQLDQRFHEMVWRGVRGPATRTEREGGAPVAVPGVPSGPRGTHRDPRRDAR